MADSTLSHLNYGHAGTTTFDTDARDWSFARQFTATTLKQIGIRDRTSIDAIPAPVQFPNTASSTRLTNTRDNARALVRNYPQLVPASQLLPDLAATSAAVISTASTYDPLIGTLFSTGSITYVNDRAGKWDNPRRVAAMVTGEAGNILRLGFLYQHALGWGSDKSVWIRGDTLRSTESGYWNEEAAPIQQVCFSQSEDRSTLLAVRLLTKTVIFRPFYSQRPRPAKQSPYYNLPPSLIDANPILTLENDESGGSPHADVTFNPDFQLQFAVVDQNQIWSVWDIDHKRKSTEYKISGVAQGSIVPAEEAEPIGEDGWARILWVGDVNTILVCNRRRLSIIGLKGNTFEYLPCSAVVPARTSDWILDVKRHPSLRNRFFALTSTDVLLMGVTTRSEAVDATVGPVGARVLLSWRHYRGAEDFTLSITVSMLDEDYACVLLRSRLNNLSQTYVVAGSYATSVALISSSDPTLLELDVDEPGHTLQVAMEPCRYQGDTTSSIPSLGRAYLAQGLSFYKLFMFRSNLSVHEIIVYATPSTAARETSRDEVKDLSWTIVFRPKKAVRTIGDIQEMDDFLQPEGIEAMTEPQSKLLSQVPRLTDRTEMDTTHRVVEHVLLYNTLSHDESDTGTTAMSLSVPVMVTQLRMRLSDSDYNAEPPMGTLLEFAAMKLDVSDVDEASLALQDLLDSQPQGDATVEARQIASNRLLHVAEGELPSISGLYDSILQSWVAPLPPHVSRGVRQQKERLARRIAAEVTSASIRVLENDMQGVVAESQPEVILDGGIAMPILPSLPVSSQWTSSQPLPTPPSSQSQFQPASQSFSSLSQASSFTISTLADPLMRLRKHLSFNEKTVPQEVMPDSVSRLLSQWQPGADPRAYDWNTAERATRIEADEEIDQQQLDKARRRKERREKRQRREDELAQVQPSNQPFVQPSSQPFTFVKPAIPRSSPGPMLPPSSQAMGQHTTSHVPLPGASSQSQWFGSFPLIQSQVEPGKFGGRPDKKKKKKARVSGF